MPVQKDRIVASFLLGACGDALGAPLEGIKSLKAITDLYGEAGLSDIIEFKNVFETGVDYPAGRVTDDTTMAMTSVAALILARAESETADDAFTDIMRAKLWQGFLNWGQHQDDGTAIARKIDPSIVWPPTVREFWFHCGAGRGTIAALLQPVSGSVSHKVSFNCLVRGQETKSPNAGCGGMMRVAAIGLLPSLPPERIFELGAESAALTNGHPDAYVAAGITALLIHHAAHGLAIHDSLAAIEETLQHFESRADYKDGIASCRLAIDAAARLAGAEPPSLKAINHLPKSIGYANKFLAIPVLAQTVYALAASQDLKTEQDVRQALVLAVNHSGDSDSVGAIVGNIIGAATGTRLIPKDWLAILTQKQAIKKMADDYCRSFLPPPAQPKTAQIKKPGA